MMATAKQALLYKHAVRRLTAWVTFSPSPVPKPFEPNEPRLLAGPSPSGVSTLPEQLCAPSRERTAMAMKAPQRRISMTMARNAKKALPPRQHVRTTAKMVYTTQYRSFLQLPSAIVGWIHPDRPGSPRNSCRNRELSRCNRMQPRREKFE